MVCFPWPLLIETKAEYTYSGAAIIWSHERGGLVICNHILDYLFQFPNSNNDIPSLTLMLRNTFVPHGMANVVPAWFRIFKPAFENALKQRERQLLNPLPALEMVQTLGVGPSGAPAHIAGAGALAAQNALSIQASITRGRGATFTYQDPYSQ